MASSATASASASAEGNDNGSDGLEFCNQMRFVGQVAIVTGGADGLGRAISRRLLLEGCSVALFDVNAEKCEATADELRQDAERHQPGNSRNFEKAIGWYNVDVTNEESVRTATLSVVEKWGALDVAVNCAGILGPNGLNIAEVTVGGFDLVHRINMTGSFLMVKHCIPYMTKRNYGRILLVASLSGKIGNPGQSAYSSSKSAVIGLAQAVGKEYAETGITVNSLSPATIYTQLVANMHPRQVEYNTQRIPMKRCGTVEEAASMVSFIVSREASFNTGFNFDLSGGRAPF